METKEEMNKKPKQSFLPFIITHPIIYAVLTIIDVFLIIFLFRVWARTEYIGGLIFDLENILGSSMPQPYKTIFAFFMMLWYYLILYFPILLFVFVIYEVVKYILFLTKDDQTQERVNDIAGGSIGTRLFRIHYFIIMFPLIGLLEFFQLMGTLPGVTGPPGEAEFLLMYSRFSIILYIFMLSLIIAPHVLRFTADNKNKSIMVKFIVHTIVWPIVLAFLFLIAEIIVFIVTLGPFP